MAQILSFPLTAYKELSPRAKDASNSYARNYNYRYEKKAGKDTWKKRLLHYQSCQFSDLMPRISSYGGSLIAEFPSCTVTIEEYHRKPTKDCIFQKKRSDTDSQLVFEAPIPLYSPWYNTGALKTTANPESEKMNDEVMGTPAVSLHDFESDRSFLLWAKDRSFPTVRISGSRIYLTSGQLLHHLSIMRKGVLPLIKQFYSENQPDDAIVIEDNRIYFYLHRTSLHRNDSQISRGMEQIRKNTDFLLRFLYL